jgi:uncharacterized membrane protein YhaH (DUF805 family)
MGGISIWQLLILMVIFALGVLPWLMALFSKKAKGTDKVVWFLVSFFFSWIGYLPYYHFVIKKNNLT